MRIVLASKFVPTGPRPIGGLQSWIKTVRSELERVGHEVVEWQPGFRLEGLFDLGVVANLKYTRPVLNFCKRSILVSHGIIDAERPESGCDVTAFVSEGVRDHWGMDGPVIRQPIDLQFWRPSDAQRTHVTRYSYRRAEIHGKACADALGLPYRHIKNASHEQAREILQSSDLVFATGRAALECMACGAPTVIYDHRSAYQGPLMDDGDFARSLENSYSGRGGYEPRVNDVIHEARKQMRMGSPRGWVERNHDSRVIVDGLLSCCT